LNYNASGSKCYNDLDSNCDTYGRLYNWATAMGINATYNSSSYNPSESMKYRGVCPEGWHIPSNADWNVLMKPINPSCSNNAICAGVGTNLKASNGWNSNGNGSDKFGFSALPGGGGRASDGLFLNIGVIGRWWSASESVSNGAYSRGMSYDSEDLINYNNSDKSSLFSVRCLKD